MENKSTIDHKTKIDIMLKQDIFVESEKPVVDIKHVDDDTKLNVHLEDTDKEELLR